MAPAPYSLAAGATGSGFAVIGDRRAMGRPPWPRASSGRLAPGRAALPPGGTGAPGRCQAPPPSCDRVYFTATADDGHPGLATSDGTEAGTEVIAGPTIPIA